MRQAPVIAGLKLRQHTFPADKLQSWLVFGHELPEVSLADQAALEVMNYILAGGHLYTRMTVETRYRYGYTNDASGFLEPRWFGPGSYTFRSYSRHDVIKPIFQNMMTEIERIQEEEVTDEELFIAKGALAEGSFQIRYLDGYAIARNFAIERLRYGDHSRSANYIDRIRAVSKEDVIEAANKFIHPEKYADHTGRQANRTPGLDQYDSACGRLSGTPASVPVVAPSLNGKPAIDQRVNHTLR